MAKTSGLGGKIQVGDAFNTLQNITNDVTNYQFSTPRAVQDITGVDKSAHERLLLLADYSATWNGVFNNSGTITSHPVFQTIPSTSVLRTTQIFPVGGTTPVMQVNCYLSDYGLTRSNTGELTWQVPGALGDGAVPTWG